MATTGVKPISKTFNITFSFTDRVTMGGNFQADSEEEALEFVEEEIGSQVENLEIDTIVEVEEEPDLTVSEDNILQFKQPTIH